MRVLEWAGPDLATRAKHDMELETMRIQTMIDRGVVVSVMVVLAFLSLLSGQPMQAVLVATLVLLALLSPLSTTPIEAALGSTLALFTMLWVPAATPVETVIVSALVLLALVSLLPAQPAEAARPYVTGALVPTPR